MKSTDERISSMKLDMCQERLAEIRESERKTVAITHTKIGGRPDEIVRVLVGMTLSGIREPR